MAGGERLSLTVCKTGEKRQEWTVEGFVPFLVKEAKDEL
jgi:hypothetical protein